VIADVPGVGANLHDHVRVPVVHRARREIAPSRVSGGLFVRSPAVERGAAPDLHFYFGRGIDAPSPVLTVTVALGRPASRGVVRLAGSDPTIPPTIDPAYLQSGADVAALVAGVRLARELARAEAFTDWRGEEVEPGSSVKGDAEIVEFLRRAADTMFHPAGTCRMGSGPDAVVDSSLRVRGVEGLRVADASVMPVAVNCPTHAACVMIGEKLADLLLVPNL
jgi:choline dehydrogenase